MLPPRKYIFVTKQIVFISVKKDAWINTNYHLNFHTPKTSTTPLIPPQHWLQPPLAPADTTTPSTSTTHPQLPQQPSRLPHLATAENIPRLEKYLLDQFCDTTFNHSTPFSVTSTKTANQI